MSSPDFTRRIFSGPAQQPGSSSGGSVHTANVTGRSEAGRQFQARREASDPLPAVLLMQIQ
jgi:hypothetical protein